MLGPLLVALWLAATAVGRLERACLWIAAGVLAALTLAALADLDRVTAALTRVHRGPARSVALGALFVAAGVAGRRSGGPRAGIAVQPSTDLSGR
jgi:hypothetical protein